MLDSKQVTDNYYLEVRCKLLEIAAIYDRYDRGGSKITASEDKRWQRCREAMNVLLGEQAEPNRAEQVALIFSDKPENWEGK